MGWCIWRPRILRANQLCPVKSGQMQAFPRPRRYHRAMLCC
jgi:hypothetical protein